MFIRKLISSTSAFALALTLSSSAFARRPPALVRAQARTDDATRSGLAKSGSGYRDVARFDRILGHDASPRRAYASAGYRDLLSRFNGTSRPGANVPGSHICSNDRSEHTFC